MALTIAFVMILTSTVFAAVPNNSIVVGGKAVSTDYLFNDVNGGQTLINELLDANQDEPVFVQLDGQYDEFTNVFTGQTATDSELDKVTKYINADGVEEDLDNNDGELEVVEVSAINCSELKVTFNKELNATAAQAKGNYVVKDNNGATVQVDNAKLDENLKDVTLTIGNGASPIAFDTTKKFTVTVAKDLSQAAAPALATALVSAETSVVDTAVPVVTAVTPIGNLAVNVTFNKPVLLNATKINTFAEKQADGKYTPGSDYTPAAFTSAAYVDGTGYKQVKIVFAAKPAGNYDLRIYGGAADIRDASGLNMVTSNRAYTVAEATTVAQATAVTVNNRTQVDVTFDAAVQVPAATSLYWGTVGTANAVVAQSPTKLRYTFTTNVIPVGSQTFTISPAASKIVDGYGNNVPTKTFTVDVAADSVTTATVNVVDDDTIDVVFSKQMKATTAVNSTTANEASNKTYFVLKDSTGKTVDLSSVTATYSEVNNVYKTRLNKANWNLKPGTYTISVSNIKDIYGDNMTAITDQAITIADTTGPSMAGVAVAGVIANRTISITFPEAMATSGDKSIANANNYAYAADGTTFAALKAGASLVASADAKSVVITLSTDEAAIVLGTSKIQIGRQAASTIYTVADAAGNIQAQLPGAVGTQHAIIGDATPTIAGGVATVKNATTINVAVTNKLGTVAAADFKYTVNGTTWKPVSNAQLVVNPTTGAHSIDFTISDTLSAKTDRTKVQVKVDNATPATKSALGTAITNGGTSAAPAATLTTWPFRTSLVSAEVLDNTHVKVTFDGLVGTINAGTNDLNQLITVAGTGLATQQPAVNTTNGGGAGQLTAAMNGASSVIMTLGTPLDTTKPITVKTYDYNVTPPANWATDKNGVPYNQNTTGITATVETTFTVVDLTATLTAAGVTTGNKIAITFNKAVDGTTIIAGLTAGGATVDCNLSITAGGALTSSNAKLGTISGFTVPAAAADFTDKATLGLDATGKVLTLTFADHNSSGKTVASYNIVANGYLTYTPDAAIKTPFGEAIASTPKNTAAAIDSKPMIYSITVANKSGGTANTIEAGDKITITFSEAIKPTTVNANLTAGGAAVTGVAKDATGGVVVTTADKTITVTNITSFVVGTSIESTDFTTDLALDSTGKVLTITLNTGTAKAITGASLGQSTTVTSTVEDATGNKLVVAGTEATPTGSFQ